MTDSTACIPPDLAQKYNIKIIPAAEYIIDGKKYTENVNITTRDAYDFIRRDSVSFTTSAVTPGQVVEAYKQLSQDSQNILFITISSKLSAVYKSADLGASLFKESSPQTNIQIIDSRSVGGGAGLPVLAAARAAEQGMNAEQVASVAEKYLKQSKCFVTMDTIRYIYRIGRASKVSARIGSLLNVRPINQVTEEGTVEMLERVRSRKAMMERVIELVKERTTSGNLTFMVSHGDAPDLAEELAGKFKDNFNCRDIIIGDYSPIMGYGGGPGAMCIAFHPDVELS